MFQILRHIFPLLLTDADDEGEEGVEKIQKVLVECHAEKVRLHRASKANFLVFQAHTILTLHKSNPSEHKSNDGANGEGEKVSSVPQTAWTVSGVGGASFSYQFAQNFTDVL